MNNKFNNIPDQDNIDWLLTSSPWTAYRTRLDILKQEMSDPEVKKNRQDLLDHPLVRNTINDLNAWPGAALQRHNDAKHSLHKLVFLADLGLTVEIQEINKLANKISEKHSPEGMLNIKVNIPVRFGGNGLDQWTWILCDSPSILYALRKMGLENPGLWQAAEFLAGMVRENGWPCAAAPELGNFKGPGKRDDPCPYATLITLKALAQFPEWIDSQACHTGAESLLALWEQRKERRPYIFGVGKRFSRLKAPLIWYDLLHFLEVLTHFKWLYKDPRFLELLDMLSTKADSEGRYKAESIWRAWADWDFGQKRVPSPWITFLAYRILQRVN